MTAIFYISSFLSVFAALMVITRLHAVHALLYMIVSLLSLAMVFFTLGAPFVAALEVIIYAGAIMVLFIFVVMMLNQGQETVAQENQWLQPRSWYGPGVVAFILLIELIFILASTPQQTTGKAVVSPKEVGAALYGPYLLGVELAAILLLAALVSAFHFGKNAQTAAGAQSNPGAQPNNTNTNTNMEQSS